MQHHQRAFAGPHTALGAFAPHSPPERRRTQLEQALERLGDLRDELIAKLDDLDLDADLEPSLGAPDWSYERGGAPQLRWADGCLDDREDPQEDEPSLGSQDHVNQDRWAWSGGHDREEEHDGREPDVEDEYSLGSHEGGAGGTAWGGQGTDDKEPSLGSLGGSNQLRWADHYSDGLETIDGEEDAGDAPELVNEDGANEDGEGPLEDSADTNGQPSCCFYR